MKGDTVSSKLVFMYCGCTQNVLVHFMNNCNALNLLFTHILRKLVTIPCFTGWNSSSTMITMNNDMYQTSSHKIPIKQTNKPTTTTAVLFTRTLLVFFYSFIFFGKRMAKHCEGQPGEETLKWNPHTLKFHTVPDSHHRLHTSIRYQSALLINLSCVTNTLLWYWKS